MASAMAAGTDPRGAWALPREEAIPRLIEEHGGNLFGLSRKICSGDQEAEDLVQEVFLQAWRKWDQYRGDSPPQVWLFTIARHACERMHRRRVGEPERVESLDELLPFREPGMAVLPEGADPLQEQFRREDREAVGVAIAELDDVFRMALVLKDIVGFTVEQVAEILGVPEATVKTRVHRARLKVRKALETRWPRRELPPPSYSRQVCMDLLQAKQEAMDRGVPMPNADEIICARCEAVFASLDFTRQLCRSLRSEEVLPERLRARLRRRLA